jgi:bifunctional non-homologous end joining protein LigD
LPVFPIATRGGDVLRYPVVGDRAALAWLAGTAAIELHPFLWTVDRPGAPRALVLDLDPGPPAGFAACARLALRVRERLAADGLEAVPKASGGKGLHLVVPLDGTQTFAETKAYARALAEALAAERPDAVVARMARAERAGKVLVDWRQNDAGLSTVAPWSLRGTPTPLVSAPLRWDEVARAAADGAPPPRIGPAEAIARLARDGDPFRGVVRRRVPSPGSRAP